MEGMSKSLNRFNRGNYRVDVPLVLDLTAVDNFEDEQEREKTKRESYSNENKRRIKEKIRLRREQRRYYRNLRKRKAKEARKRGAVTVARSQMLLEKLEEKNFHVLNELINIYQRAEKLDTVAEELALKEKIASKLMSYCFPKLRSLEVSSDTGQTTLINLTIPQPESINVTPPQKVLDSNGSKEIV
jgi:hypothetical protein